MTREEKIEFLNRYKEIDDVIDQKCEELSIWHARALMISPLYSDMPKGGVQEDKIQSAVEKIIALEDEINSKIDILVKARDEIVMAVRTVDDKNQRRLLVMRYLNRREDYTWEQIAAKMNYTYRHVTRLHSLALNMLHIV